MTINIQLFATPNFSKQRDAGLLKTIASFEANIAKHKEKLLCPSKYDANWNEKTNVQKQGLINHWNKEIKNFEKQLLNAKQEAEKRGIL